VATLATVAFWVLLADRNRISHLVTSHTHIQLWFKTWQNLDDSIEWLSIANISGRHWKLWVWCIS